MMTPRSVAVASSPGREKLPAPPGLARLLIRKTRSRSVARASPMFGVRSRSVGPTGRSNDGQGEEPSSPKVTCIGQVRMRTGAKGKNKKKRAKSKTVKCRCLNRVLFCGVVCEGKKKTKKKKKDEKITRCRWPCWGRGCCTMKSDHHSKSSKNNEVKIHEEDRVTAPPLMARYSNVSEEPGRFSNFNDEPGRYSNFSDEPARTSNYGRRSFVGRGEISDQEEEDEEGEQGNGEKGEEPLEEKELVSSATTTPPKNALFLMRCRSAPQHHSRFAPSPNIAIEETTEVKLKTTDENSTLETTKENDTEEKTILETEKLNEEKEEETEEEEEDEEEEEEEMRCSSARPLVLTRCKSEPASKGEKLIGPAGPETASTSCFWAHTGSGSRQKRMGAAMNGLEQRTPSPLPTH